MIPEIKLLSEKFSGKQWNKSTQEEFIDELAQSDFFEGKGSPTDKAFSARDRINRAPKALGFIDLSPCVALTDAGNSFVYGKRPQEIFLRQLLKFQLPSPYHSESKNIVGTFYVRPYLEVLRLIRELEYITFDEFKIYAVQMTDYHKFETIRDSILQFREEKSRNKGKYKRFANDMWENAILEIHKDRIAAGKTRTRETNDASLKKFIATQKSNMRDYADACFRYLRYTGLISISHKSRSISIFDDKIIEVDFILKTVSRDPVFIDDINTFKTYLFSSSFPTLYTDNEANIIDVLMHIGSFTRRELADKTLDELKDLRDDIVKRHKDAVIYDQVAEIKSYALYSEIIDTFNAAPGGTAGNMDPGEDTVGKIFFPHPFNTMGQKPLRTAQSLLTDRDTDAAGAGLKEIFPSPSRSFQDPGHLLCCEMKEIHGPVRGKTNLCIRNIFQHFTEYQNTFPSKAASYRMIRNPVKSWLLLRKNPGSLDFSLSIF